MKMRVIKKSEIDERRDKLVEAYEALADDEALEFSLPTEDYEEFCEQKSIRQKMRELWQHKQLSRIPKFRAGENVLWCFKGPRDWRHPGQWCGLCDAPVVGQKGKHFEEVHPIYRFHRGKSGMYSSAYCCAVCNLKIYALERLAEHYQTAHPELIIR